MFQEILAIIPFIFLIYFFIIKEKKAYIVMFFTFLLTLFLVYFFWKINFFNLFLSSIKGFIIGFEIFLIIFGAILLFKIVEVKKNLLIIENFFKNFCNDKYIQLLIIGFFLVAFFEGIAGFGIPAMICAPILIFLGFKKIPSVVVCLTTDAMAVSFGAFGTPILYGIKQGTLNSNIIEVAFFTSFIMGILMIFTPLFLLFIYEFLTEKKFFKLKKYFWLSLFSGFIFASIFFLTGFLSLQLPSVLASILGLIIFIFILKKNFLIELKTNKTKNFKKIFYAFIPYIFLIIFLIIIRFNFFYIGNFFNFFTINIIGYDFSFSSLGFLLLYVGIIFLIIYRFKKNNVKKIFLYSFNKTKFTFLTLIFTLMFVQVLLISNSNNLLGIPQIIANFFSEFGVIYIFFSSFIGVFGAFLSGSVTVSNLIFSQIQYDISQLNNLNPNLILALQVVGGSIGNLISIQNLVAVSSVVNLHHQEHKLFKINFFIVLGYCFITGIIGFLIWKIL